MNIKDRVDGLHETGMIKDFWLAMSNHIGDPIMGWEF